MLCFAATILIAKSLMQLSSCTNYLQRAQHRAAFLCLSLSCSSRGDIDIQGFLEQQLQPRMITCLSVLLSSSPNDPAATQSKLECLLHLPSHQQQQQQSADPQCQQQQQQQQQSADLQQEQQRSQAHALMILDLMQHLPRMQAAVVQQCCQQLLLWVIQTARGSLCSSILAAGPAGGAMLQHVLHCCLLCWGGCAEVLQQQQQQELIGAVTAAGRCLLECGKVLAVCHG